MKSLMLSIEILLECLNARGRLLALLPPSNSSTRALEQVFKLLTYGSQDRLAVFVYVIHHDDPLAEASGLKPLVNNLERCLLLTDDKQASAGAYRIGNHVDDRLALTSPRRALYEKATP
jgi:hypothetical protein